MPCFGEGSLEVIGPQRQCRMKFVGVVGLLNVGGRRGLLLNVSSWKFTAGDYEHLTNSEFDGNRAEEQPRF